MAISEQLKVFLQASKVSYSAATHPLVYTAQEIAAAQHVPGRQLAKCVLVNTDRDPVLAVLPATHLIDLKKLKTFLRAKNVAIAKEDDIKRRFPDVEVGAMSPFGNLYHVPVIVDLVLEGSDAIVFNAGSHTDTIKMRYSDFARLVKPNAGSFSHPISGPKAKKKRGVAARHAKRSARLKRRRP